LYEPLYGTAKCQDLSISDQLKAGVRFLDIRCRHYYNSFAIHHGSIFQNQNFDDVLNACFSFLAADSNETIIMSVNEEYTPEGTTRSFEDTFFAYYSKNTKGWYVGESIPTLGAVRGKIVLFRRFSAQNHLPLGLPADDWQDNTTFSCSKVWIRVQDCYQVTDNNSKYSYITSFLSEAVAGPGYMMYLNFTSGYQLGLYGIPDIRVVSNFINDNVNGYFSACGVARYGIVILNFANSSLCTKIYSKN
jgi:1-phosphatidylinositol phosphodiesterase